MQAAGSGRLRTRGGLRLGLRGQPEIYKTLLGAALMVNANAGHVCAWIL
jgi:hypothetical protein